MGAKPRNFALAVLLAALAAEAALRISVFLPLGHRDFIADTEIGLRLRPGAAQSDRLGFRDGEAGLAAGAEIAFVGDSFVYGVPAAGPSVAEIVGARLGRRTANLGVPGSGPSEYEKVARVYAEAPSIRLIVVGIFVGNDVHQAHPGHATLSFAGDLRSLPPPGRFDVPLDEWYLPRGILGLVRRARPPCLAEAPILSRAAAAESRLYLAGAAGDFGPNYANLAGIVARIHARAEARGVKLLAVVQPTRLQTDKAFASAIAGCLGRSPDAYDVAAPSRHLMREFAAYGIPSLDLTRLFADAGGNGLYIEGDTHWNDAGNRLAGEAIALEIRRRFGL